MREVFVYNILIKKKSLGFLKFISIWPKYMSQKNVSNKKSRKLQKMGSNILLNIPIHAPVWKLKEVNVLGSVLENNLLWILKIHPGSPGNPPGNQLVKNTSSTVLEHGFCSTFHNTFCSDFRSACLKMPVFAALS
jgi:hypothetical protein